MCASICWLSLVVHYTNPMKHRAPALTFVYLALSGCLFSGVAILFSWPRADLEVLRGLKPVRSKDRDWDLQLGGSVVPGNHTFDTYIVRGNPEDLFKSLQKQIGNEDQGLDKVHYLVPRTYTRDTFQVLVQCLPDSTCKLELLQMQPQRFIDRPYAKFKLGLLWRR